MQGSILALCNIRPAAHPPIRSYQAILPLLNLQKKVNLTTYNIYLMSEIEI